MYLCQTKSKDMNEGQSYEVGATQEKGAIAEIVIRLAKELEVADQAEKLAGRITSRMFGATLGAPGDKKPVDHVGAIGEAMKALDELERRHASLLERLGELDELL